VYIIHGVGKGRLKEMIHARLKRHSDVEHFKNEYHERYGWGATEVIL
jgi:dsDNA-specific endonuclease/ATPase MutS2